MSFPKDKKSEDIFKTDGEYLQKQVGNKVYDNATAEELKKVQIRNNLSRILTGQSLNANQRNLNEPKLVINVAYTQYELVQAVARENNFALSMDEEGEEEWDVWWIDG